MKTDDFTYYEGMADALDLFEQFLDTLPEQPEVDLKKEVTKFVLSKEYIEGKEPPVLLTARHFYELGCRHTAVMYDDIEFERQRAEETELSGDLEDEAINYCFDKGINLSPRQAADFARHFAEWGAIHFNTRKEE